MPRLSLPKLRLPMLRKRANQAPSAIEEEIIALARDHLMKLQDADMRLLRHGLEEVWLRRDGRAVDEKGDDFDD
jgi:hypothetical protein